jgi:hypothetical protein
MRQLVYRVMPWYDDKSFFIQIAKDPILLPILLPKRFLITNDTEAVSSTLARGYREMRIGLLDIISYQL